MIIGSPPKVASDRKTLSNPSWSYEGLIDACMNPVKVAGAYTDSATEEAAFPSTDRHMRIGSTLTCPQWPATIKEGYGPMKQSLVKVAELEKRKILLPARE